jgi:V8-like Glu-specific endopeptidase
MLPEAPFGCGIVAALRPSSLVTSGHLIQGGAMFGLFSRILAVLLLSASPALSDGGAAAQDGPRGWDAVGRLDLGSHGFCTAAMITPDVVVTAAHCLFDKHTRARIPADALVFRAGLRFGRAAADRGVRRVVLHPHYDFGDGDSLNRVGSDLALLELERPVDRGEARPFGTQTRIVTGQDVQVVSYAQGRADAPSKEEACNVLARNTEILVLSCSVEFGASGSPVFARFGDETRIVSVISAKARWKGRSVALAAVMEGELDLLVTEFARTRSWGRVAKTLDPEAIEATSADGPAALAETAAEG